MTFLRNVVVSNKQQTCVGVFIAAGLVLVGSNWDPTRSEAPNDAGFCGAHLRAELNASLMTLLLDEHRVKQRPA